MKRLVAIGAALLLAALGAWLLVSYVRGAENRALEGQTLVSVYVVTDEIAAGTAADDIIGSVELRDLQADAVAEGVVADLDDIDGLVAAVDLLPGEQLLGARFQTPRESAVGTRIDLPPELLQATIVLTPERALGGRLVPGDLVAVIASFEPFGLAGVEPSDPESLEDALDTIGVVPTIPGTPDTPAGSLILQTPNSTRIIIRKVLVTGVQIEEVPQESLGSLTGGTTELAPTGNLLITIAANAEEIEKIVFTAEHGFLWLALEDPEAPEYQTDIKRRLNIYE